MEQIFKPTVTPKLLEFLIKHEPIRMLLKQLPYDLEKILAKGSLVIPNEYDPKASWLATWGNLKKIKPKHVDLLVTLLKFAWLYSDDQNLNEFWQSVIGSEITLFLAGAKLGKGRNARQKVAKKPRPWTKLDQWIRRRLKSDPDLADNQLWDKLPESYQRGSIYKSGDEVCEKNTEKSIKFRSFKKHCKSQRMLVQIATANCKQV